MNGVQARRPELLAEAGEVEHRVAARKPTRGSSPGRREDAVARHADRNPSARSSSTGSEKLQLPNATKSSPTLLDLRGRRPSGRASERTSPSTPERARRRPRRAPPPRPRTPPRRAGSGSRAGRPARTAWWRPAVALNGDAMLTAGPDRAGQLVHRRRRRPAAHLHARPARRKLRGEQAETRRRTSTYVSSPYQSAGHAVRWHLDRLDAWVVEVGVDVEHDRERERLAVERRQRRRPGRRSGARSSRRRRPSRARCSSSASASGSRAGGNSGAWSIRRAKRAVSRPLGMPHLRKIGQGLTRS